MQKKLSNLCYVKVQCFMAAMSYYKAAQSVSHVVYYETGHL